MDRFLLLPFSVILLVASSASAAIEETNPPRFTRHVQAVFSRLGCNGGTCHGAVKGQNGFRLTLFGADPRLDHERLLREGAGRRLDLLNPEASLLLQKATGRTAHQGGARLVNGSSEYQILRRWIAAGAPLDPVERSRVTNLHITPAARTAHLGESYQLHVEAAFADGSREDVSGLCSYESLSPAVATVNSDGRVAVRGVGDAALLIRFRAEPALATLVVPRTASEPPPDIRPHNFIDRHILAKLHRLNIPPAELCDDATFLRRASLDVTGELPASDEVRAFLADKATDKRERKIEELLHRPGHAALWTLKFCDLLKATDFGVYADGIRQEVDAPRFQQWVRARLEENIPYDEFVERILTATSREDCDVDSWAKEVLKMEEGYAAGRPDLEMYRRRRTLDLYWQRSSSTGVAATLQVAHAFLGLRLECAQCHRHPHDVWQQDDLLSFANFFMPVRKIGFQGDNEKKFPATAAVFKRMNDEAKTLTEQVKKMRESEFKQMEAKARTARPEADRLGREAAKLEKDAEQAAAAAKTKRVEAEKNAGQAEQLRRESAELEAKAKQAIEKSKQLRTSLATHQTTLAESEKMRKQLAEMEHRARSISEAARRVLHSEVRLLEPGKDFATVTSPIGTQSSRRYRLLGQTEEITMPKGEDPRRLVMAWLRRPDNPYFARAIVNRVWASYFGHGIIDPPDNLSSFNPPSHPELLQELSQAFIEHNYDLKWLHRTILCSRTYQQSSMAGKDNDADHANYAYFYYRRLSAEVLVDALNQATGTTEKMEMEYYFWPANLKTIEAPYTPKNSFIAFMLANFGKPKRNSAVQCDCERDGNPSVLQVLSFANHPHVWAKITNDKGQVARIVKEFSDDARRIEEVFLVCLSRFPRESELRACQEYLRQASSPTRGLQGILWSLLNTREFVLQH